MIRAAIAFYVLGLFVFLVGGMGWAGVSLEIGSFMLALCLGFSFLAFMSGITAEAEADRIRE